MAADFDRLAVFELPGMLLDGNNFVALDCAPDMARFKEVEILSGPW